MKKTVNELMALADEYAKAWHASQTSRLIAAYDDGDHRKVLREALETALNLKQSEYVSDEENEQFSQDVSNFKGADPEATKYALGRFLRNRLKLRLWEPLPSKVTEEMHQAACKVMLRANGPDGTQQRMLDAMRATAPPADATSSTGRVHRLKLHKDWFSYVLSGAKSFEIRKDDRGGFEAGDTLVLEEYTGLAYTGRACTRKVTFVLNGPLLGLEGGYSILAIQPQTPQHTDDAAVDRFASAMKAKMAASRAKGRGGWDDKRACVEGNLQRMLIEHIAKGEPVDVGNFAMMLFNRGEQTAVRKQFGVNDEQSN